MYAYTYVDELFFFKPSDLHRGLGLDSPLTA